MKHIKGWPGLVPVGVWLAGRTGIPRQTLMSAAQSGQLTTERLADGTVCARYHDVLAWAATHTPRRRRR